MCVCVQIFSTLNFFYLAADHLFVHQIHLVDSM